MQASVQASSQLHGLSGTTIAGLLVANLAMKRDVQILPIQTFIFLDMLLDDGFLLRMDSDQHTALPEDTLQGAGIIHQHVARR